MSSGLKPYPAYWDSGAAWLGDVPEHWSAPPNRALFTEVKERDHPEEVMLSVTITQGVIKQTSLLKDSSKKDGSNEDKSAYKLLRPGEIAYNKMRAWQGAVGASEFRGIVSPAYVVQRLRGDNLPRYYHYLFRTPAFAKEAERWSYGITSDMWSLRPQHFKLIRSCLPPPDEQFAIVRYLDHMNRKIRRYINAKRKLIKLLEEQKQITTNEAVTGQIDVRTGRPYLTYKDSSSYLQRVPADWEIVRLKHLLCGQLANGIFKTKDFFGRGVPLVNVKDIYRDDFTICRDGLETVEANESEVSAFAVRAGDIFFVRSSLKLEGTGRSALLAVCQGPTLFECHLVRARPQQTLVTPRFLVLYLNSQAARDYLISRANTVTMSTLPQGAMSTMDVALPPREDQDRIVDAIDAELEAVEATRRNAFRHVELILQFHHRLIEDVVTGKLDVRDAASSLPRDIDEALSLEDEDMLAVEGETDEAQPHVLEGIEE